MKKPVLVFVDCGVAADHPTLKEDIIREIVLKGEDVEETERNGHGTAIYGILRKLREEFDIISVKVQGIQEGVSGSTLCDTLEYIEKNIEAEVINLSLGAPVPEDKERLEEVCRRLDEKGCVIVSAFDNGGTISYPAAFENVIGVVSDQSCQRVEDYVVFDDEVMNIAGKGGVQRLLWNTPNMLMLGGNSFACAHISVLVARLILEGYKGRKAILAELKRRAGGAINIGKDGSIPKLNFRIQKAAVFPFNKEMHALFRFYEMLDFTIEAVYDSKYTARVGADTAYLLKDEKALSLKIRNIDAIDWSEFDTLILGHSDAMEETIGKTNYRDALIEKALEQGKNLYTFDEVPSLYDVENVFTQRIDERNLPCYRNGMLYQISKPVVAVCGTSSKQGKFTLQLELRKRLMKEGYRVGQLGTEPNALLFGMNHIFPMGYNGAVHLSEGGSVLYLNALMNDMCDNDLILVGSQSGSVTYDLGNLEQYTLMQNSYMLGTQPDAVILCINPFDGMDYIGRTIKYLESVVESKVIALVLYPMDITDKWTGIYGRRIKVDEAKIQTLSEEVRERFGLPLYCLGKEDDMEKVKDALIDFFAEEEDG